MIRRTLHSLLGGVHLRHALIAFTLIFPLLSPAAEQEIFRGQTIIYEGATLEWVNRGTPEEELILIFSNTTTGGTLQVPADATARILAVGGGGAGGTVRSSTTTYSGHSGGGGGGGGEVVEFSNMALGKDKLYKITVGAGGKSIATSTSSAQQGGNGDDSFISLSSDGDVLRVRGGGGGGGESVGAEGGTGGGGSYKSTTVYQGGEAKPYNSKPDDYNGNGGDASKRYGGGGGGAGGMGEPGQSNRGGNGGDGVASEIRPSDGENNYYGGGGGGGNTNTGDAGLGGKGGGGNGSKTASSAAAAVAPTAGTNGRGGGGGGAGRFSIGAAGGSGIVIIRLTNITTPLVWRKVSVTSADGKGTGYIYVDNKATTTTDGNDLVITYQEEHGALSLIAPEGQDFTTPVWAQARVLAVGGGGGGGLIRSLNATAGGGAGGGAGGFVEQEGIELTTNGVYNVTVGRGGAGASVDNTAGESGTFSALQQGGVNIVPVALGGGGGGAAGAGAAGGSGGGGSFAGGVSSLGGEGAPGQGFAGGSGEINYRGAGGGGAGGKGGDVVSGATSGGLGGLAKKSDISGSEVWYAGGGGGAYINLNNTSAEKFLGGLGGGTATASEKGGGGNGAGCDGGASGTELNPVAPQNGADGYGGGGGGGVGVSGVTGTGGNGGSGVVIIRLSGFVVGAVTLPPEPKNYIYNGEEQSAITARDAWAYQGQLSGTWKATNAGTYTFTAELPADKPYEFAGGGRSRQVTWTISPMEVVLPEIRGEVNLTNSTPWVFNNVMYQAVVDVDESKTNRGVDERGYCWTAATTGNHIPLDYCWLEKTGGDDDRGYINKNAGTNTITVTLNNPLPITNFVWSSRSASPRELYWHIAQADNEFTDFTIADKQEGITIEPSSIWTWQPNSSDKVVYTYFKGEEQPGGTNFYTIVETPTEPGIYWAHAYICKDSKHEPGNWKDAHAYTRFCIWRHPAKTLTDFVNITANGVGNLPNFPVLVRLSEPQRGADGTITNGIPGFTYARAGLTGKELRFVQRTNYKTTDATRTDELLPYEIETWNPSGESRVWVKVNPTSYTGTKDGKFRMYWHRDPTQELFADKPATEVWSAYTGVWHMNEEVLPAEAEKTYSLDATGNGLDLVPKMGGNKNNETIDGNFKEMISVPGVFGNARQIASTAQENGNYLEVPQYELGSTFIFSCWVKVDKFEFVNESCYPQLVCRKPTASAGDGWHVELNGAAANKQKHLTIRGGSGGDTENNNFVNREVMGTDWDKTTGYTHLSVVFTGGSSGKEVKVYVDGALKATRNMVGAPSNANELPLAIGNGMFGETTKFHYPALEGSFDEIRLYALPSSYDAWAKAEYNTVANANFCTFGLVNKPDDDNPDERVWVNYWSVEPSLKRYWNLGELTSGNITATSAKGALKFVGTVTYLGRKMPSGELWDGDGKTVPSNVKGPNTVEYYMSPMNLTSGDYPGRHILFDGTRIFDVEIVESNPKPVDPLGPTASGRILLANDDMTPDAAGFVVTNQSYFEEAWYHQNTDHIAPDQFNLWPGYNHEYTNATSRLWKLRDIYIGNILSTNHELAVSSAILPADYLTLPRGLNSKNISSEEAYTNEFQWYEAGHLVMRNVADAQIVSSLYTNGIGKVYFDVVNAYGGTDVNAADNWLVVEYADNKNDEDDDGTEWTRVPMLVLDMKNSTISTNEAASGQQLLTCLAKKHSEATSSPYLGRYFFRVIADIDRREPTRFRIRRDSTRPSDGDPEQAADDPKGWILIDNVIASFPPPMPIIKPIGAYDESRTGSSVLGVEGAFSVQYPVAGDKFYVYGQIDGAITNVTSARLRYRWRYLDTESVPLIYEGRENWNVAYFNVTNNIFATFDPLDYPARYGDIEYYLDMTGFAAYYKYTDYTGINYGEANLKKIPSEDPEKYVEARSKVPRYPSHGHDWFVRLREFRNSTRGYTLYTKTGELDEDKREIITTNALELVGTNAWRVCVRTDKPVEELSFALESDIPASTGIGETATLTNYWKTTELTAASLPYTFGYSKSESRSWATIPSDAKTGYLLFAVDETKQQLSVYRADFQNFNRWSTAVNTNGLFVGNSTDSNTVNYATNEYNPEWKNWKATPETRENWHEDFKVDDGMIAPQVYPRNQPFSSFRSQRNWTAQNGMWTCGKWAHVSEKKVGDITTYGQGDDSAVQLEGRGKGALMYAVAEDIPDGLDTITYVARVAQYNEFKDFAYYDGAEVIIDESIPGKYTIDYARNKTQGTFVTMAALTEIGDGSYDGDGSVSLVGFYRPDKGCYEVRFSRGGKDSNIHIELYRWSVIGGEMTCTSLGYHEFNDQAEKLVREGPSKLAGIFLSVEEYTNTEGKHTGTLINAGIMNEDATISTPASYMSEKGFYPIVYMDTSDFRLKSGTFGVLARNCPGVFVKPAIYPLGIGSLGGNIEKATGENKLDFYSSPKNIIFRGTPNLGSATEEFYSNWILPPGRTMRLDTTNYGTSFECWGFQAVTNVTQKIIVQLSDHGDNKWIDTVTNTVSGFCDQKFVTPVKSGVKRDVRLQVAGGPNDTRRDVVINEVKMSQWNGQWTENYDQGGSVHYLKDKFVYSAGWIVDDPLAINSRALRLQPARAPLATDPVALRTPLLRGLGLFHFQWRKADPRCKLLVQICEEATEQTILSLTDAESNDTRWRTVQTLDMATAGTTGSRTVYLNKRYNGKVLADETDWVDYYYGVVRIIIDREVVAVARQDETARNDSEYGMIEIVDAFAWDLPEYDPKGWSGWNFRAAGWNGADPDTFANLTDGTRGLSGLLNNTLDVMSLAQRPAEYYRDRMPNVQSPTFGTNCVGEVSFRARLYNSGDAAAAGHGAIVSVYGAHELDEKGEPKPGAWKKAGEVVVTNTIYTLHSLKLKSSDDFKAVRLAIEGVEGVTDAGVPSATPPIRVALDDIVIWEKLPLSVMFRKDYVRPFRSATELKLRTEVRDITSMEEQPLLDEAFGFQGEVVVADTEEIIVGDPEYPITVDLWYYPGDDVWGFENWKTSEGAVCVEIPCASDNPFVFRSNSDIADSLCTPQSLGERENHRIVQYQLVANFYDQSHEKLSHAVTPDEWAPPSWNTGFADPNRKANAKFSPYTVLEEIAPKRAWINEVNYCEPTLTASQASQWIELAIPSGIDMTGWKLKLYKNNGDLMNTLVTLGMYGSPAKKNYTGSSLGAQSSHYAFYVVKSPHTVLNENEYDAVWSGTVNGNGALGYSSVYAFELVRPSGIIEHRAVVQGWNQYRDAGYDFADLYDGDKVTEELNKKLKLTDELWVWAEEDRHAPETAMCSVNVTNEQGQVHENWASPLRATPGDINVGQYIDPKWFTSPNGGYVWIYSTVLGDHLRQIVDGAPQTFTRLTVPQGTTTNLVYEVDRWYQLAELSATGTEGRTNVVVTGSTTGDGKRYYDLTLTSVSNRIDITVKADASEEVLANVSESDKAYRQAILKWLEGGITRDKDGFAHPFKGNEIQPHYYYGVDGTQTNKIDLTGCYWLDIDPTDGDWQLWGGMGVKPGYPGVPGGTSSSWSKVRERRNASGELVSTRTNVQTVVWLMITNRADGTAYAPFCLQGIGGERSDSFVGVWTSETFKVTAALQNGKVNDFYYPMRYFVFDKNSFGGELTEELSPFGALVEIADPFLPSSPGSELGWRPYSQCGVITGWSLDTKLSPAGVSTLKPNSTLSF